MAARKYPRLLCPQNRNGDLWFLYMIGVAGDGLKVGITKYPLERLQSHKSALEITWLHFFSGMPGHALRVETEIKRRLTRVSERVGRTELFRGIDKAAAIAIAREEIDFYRATVGA